MPDEDDQFWYIQNYNASKTQAWLGHAPKYSIGNRLDVDEQAKSKNTGENTHTHAIKKRR
jgi:hypothetical protein